MKKRICLITIIGLLLFVVPIIARAEIVGSGIWYNLSWTLTDDGQLTISGTGEMTSLNNLNYAWRPKRKMINSVVIENGVTSISEFAFDECSKLSSISLPETLTHIDNYAFFGCESLTNINIPDNVTTIGDSAFRKCQNLKDFVVPDNLTYLGDNVFLGISTSSISFYASYKSDGALCICKNGYSFYDKVNRFRFRYVFNDNEEITDIYLWGGKNADTVISIPDGVTIIQNSAFLSHDQLVSITIPDSVTRISNSAFNDCKNLSSINIPNGISSIEDSSFRDCSSLTSISIPDSVTNIGAAAFYGCSSLESISIPENVTSIGSYAFSRCSSLENISIPESVTSIGSYAFSYCSSLTNIPIPYSVTIISSNVFSDCSNLRTITIPNNITEIHEDAFRNCSNLKSIIIPENVCRIGDGAFRECDNLDDIYIVPENDFFIVQDDILYNKNMTELILCPAGKKSILVVPDGVTTFAKYSFYSSLQLSGIVIPKTVIDIPELDMIFKDGTKLIIGVEEDSVAYSTFINSSYCYSFCLVGGQLGENITWKGDIISGKVTISGTGDMYSKYSSSPFPWALSAFVEEGITGIASHTFCNCSYLSSVRLPDSLEAIGEDAFYGCTQLTTLTIPEHVTYIADNHFLSSCPKLSKIYLPNSIRHLYESAFQPSIYVNAQTGEIIITHSPIAIYCYENSYAASYAIEHKYDVVFLDNSSLMQYGYISLPDDISIFVGQEVNLTVNVFPMLPSTTISWSSSNSSVVAVDQNGIIKANAGGTAIISVSSNNMQASMVVTVKEYVKEIIVSDEIFMLDQTSMPFPVTILPIGAESSLIFNYTYKSSFSISSGIITSKRVGQAKVTIKDKLTGITATTTVFVCHPVSAISFEESFYSIDPYETKQIIANVTMQDQNCVNHLVTFTSSNPDIVTISGDGFVHGIKPGTVTITAEAESGVFATTTVSVRNPSILMLPMNLKAIDNNAFEGIKCELVIIPAGCTFIGEKAFANCENLRRVIIPTSVTHIADDAFEGCNENLVIDRAAD